MRAYPTFDAANDVFNAKPTVRSIVALGAALMMLLAASGGLSLAVAAEDDPATDTEEEDPLTGMEEPVIKGFDYGHSYGDLYYFVGEVTGLENNAGVDVNFGDIIEGGHVVTDIDGTFYYEADLPSGVADWASAVATSDTGVPSEESLIWVETL